MNNAEVKEGTLNVSDVLISSVCLSVYDLTLVRLVLMTIRTLHGPKIHGPARRDSGPARPVLYTLHFHNSLQTVL